jgi:hypothetical protein
MKTWIRTASLALSAALALAVAGCGSSNTCTDATPPVANTPSACTAVQGVALTVPINTCPRCDQSTPTCDVRAAGGGRFTLEPVSQVCDPNSSCPIPDPKTCAALATNCTLSSALTSGLAPGTSYFLDIVTEAGVDTKPLTVVASGSGGCTP